MAAHGLWQFYNQDIPANLPAPLKQRLQELKDEAIKVLTQNYGKGYWAGKVSPPNAAQDANTAADRLIPDLGSNNYATRAKADADLRELLLKYINDGNYEGYKALLAKIQAAQNDLDAEVASRAKGILVDSRISQYIKMDAAKL